MTQCHDTKHAWHSALALPCAIAISWACLQGSSSAQTAADTVRIYVDADFSSAGDVARAMRRGFELAIDLHGGRIGDARVEFVELDHRRNARRSARHLEAWLSDPRALAVIGGTHSPVLIDHRDRINRDEILTLNPWAAGATITRPKTNENWIFRLSLDDAHVPRFLLQQGRARGHSRPALIVDESSWGNANLERLLPAAKQLEISVAGVMRFPWGVTDEAAIALARELAVAKPDHLIFIGNLPEFAALLRAFADYPSLLELPIISHWGILMGNPVLALGSLPKPPKQLLIARTTPFSEIAESPRTADLSHRVLAEASRRWPDDRAGLGSPAEPAFLHAFDLALVVMAAAEGLSVAADPKAVRHDLRTRMENLQDPVEGLLHRYTRPFGAWSTEPEDHEAHEALRASDFVLTHFQPDGRMILDRATKRPD